VKISVILPTVREKGLFDITLPGLLRQTMPKEDWELVLVDDFPRSREADVRRYAGEHGMNVKWMRSKPARWRTNAPIACARNTGLIHAEGELCVFIDDFSWVRPRYLETVWGAYDPVDGFSHIGPVVSVEYSEPPYPDDLSRLRVRHGDHRVREVPTAYGIPGGRREKVYEEHRRAAAPCPAGWFFTSNASAPLEKIVEVNGFWEILDTCREEDVMMGLALERAGWRFCFMDTPDATVYHVCHDYPELTPRNRRYREVTYEQLGWGKLETDEYGGGHRGIEGMTGRGRCGLDTAPDEVQLITKDVFNTEHPGSWACIEHFRRNPDLKFNTEIGFDLAEERRKVQNRGGD